MHRLTNTRLKIIVAAMLLFSSCADRVEGEYFGKVIPPTGQTLRYVSGSEPETLDPQMSTAQPEARIHMALYEGLVEYHPRTQEPIPALAERWQINEDATEFVFTLRRGARWSDGAEITAHDFVYTIRRGLSPALASRAASLAFEIENAKAYNSGGAFVRDPATDRFVLEGEADTPDSESQSAQIAAGQRRLVVPYEAARREALMRSSAQLATLLAGKDFVKVRAEDVGVEAADDYTLRLRLRRPAPYFVRLLPHPFFRLVPRQIAERHGAAWTRPEHLISCGPFKLRAHEPYHEIVVEKNEAYWDAARVRLERISFYPLEDTTAVLNLYKAGEVDAVHNHAVPPSWLKGGVRATRDYMDAPENAVEYYQINTTVPPMDDARVRRAFSLAIDREALAEYRVVAKPLAAFTPDGVFDTYPRPRHVGFDPGHARRLLAEAGFRDDAGTYDAGTFPVGQVEIIYTAGDSARQIAEFVQAQWKRQLRITVPVRAVERKTFLSLRSRREYKGFARFGWSGDYVDPYTFLAIFSTAGHDNGTGWFDARYAALLDEANAESDPARRYELLANAESLLLEAQPIIPLLTPATNWVKKPYVKGMYPNPGTLHPWKFVYIEHDPALWVADAQASIAGEH